MTDPCEFCGSRAAHEPVAAAKCAYRYQLRQDTAPVSWGAYATAIERWQRVLGRPAPRPTEPGARGGERLSPRFVEWLMGLPDGWVTDVPDLSRNAQLKILGNGVVPAQAALALRTLLPILDGRAA